MLLKSKIILAIVSSIFLTLAMIVLPTTYGIVQLSSANIEERLTSQRLSIQMSLEDRYQKALAMAETIAANSDVQRGVAARDTAALANIFAPHFAQLSEETGVAQYQFHTPEAISILRVHNPGKYGDDLSAFRHTVVEANANQKSVFGLERGRAGLGIRGIAPITHDGKHVGTVEIGLRFNEDLLQDILGDTGSRMEVYLLPDLSITTFDDVATQIQRLSVGLPDTALLSSDEVLSLAEEESQDAKLFEIGGKAYQAIAFTIYDFSGNPVALSHVLIPNSASATILGWMIEAGLIAIAITLAIGVVGAWLFGRILTRNLERIVWKINDLEKGDLATDLSELSSARDEIGKIATGLEVLRCSLSAANSASEVEERLNEKRMALFHSLGSAMEDLKEGKVDTQIESADWKELGESYQSLCENFNGLSSTFDKLTREVNGSLSSVKVGADELKKMSTDMSRRATTQAATLEQSAAALEEMSSSVKSSAERAKAASEMAIENRKRAETGTNVLKRAMDAMSNISNSSVEITSIITVIDDIAFQTNLLALNAGVEAARAGESGKGFGVVAAEVHTLAQRASESAQQIRDLVLTSASHVENGEELMKQTHSTFTEIVDKSGQVTNYVSEIAVSAQEQSAGIQEINIGVSELDSVTQQNASMVIELNTTAEHLLTQAQRAASVIAEFLKSSVNNAPAIDAPIREVVDHNKSAGKERRGLSVDSPIAETDGPVVRNGTHGNYDWANF